MQNACDPARAESRIREAIDGSPDGFVMNAAEVGHEICSGEWQDALRKVRLRGLRRSDQQLLSARDIDAAVLLRSDLPRKSLQQCRRDAGQSRKSGLGGACACSQEAFDRGRANGLAIERASEIAGSVGN